MLLIAFAHKEEAYAAYEDLLSRLKFLFDDYDAIVGGCHSLNVRLCRNSSGRCKLYILDGKLAGLTQQCSVYRLSIKLRCERVEYHRWLLAEYIEYLKGVGVGDY